MTPTLPTLDDLRAPRAQALDSGLRLVAWELTDEAAKRLLPGFEWVEPAPGDSWELLGLPVVVYDMMHDTAGCSVSVRLITEAGAR